MQTHRLAAMVAGLCVLAVVSARGATPTFWHVATRADFLKGDVEHLTIDSDGRLELGPAAELVYETTAPFVWSVVGGTDGTLWAGTGNDGAVLRINRSGSGSTFFDAPELAVHAMAVAPDGGLYVGTSPNGTIYKVAADGRTTPFFDPQKPYIWALQVGPDGTVWAATGNPGVIYRITPDGQGQPFYETRATHVVSLALDGNGNVLAGTGSPGQILRIDRAGKAFALLDSPFREITALRFDRNGVLYAAALSPDRPRGEDSGDRQVPDVPRESEVPPISTEVTVTAFAFGDLLISPGTQAQPTGPEAPRGPRGAVYRVAPDGGWEIVWESDADLPYDLISDATGALVIGTGNTGKIFRVIDGDPPRETLLTRAAAGYVTRFLRGDDGSFYYATANPGKVFRLSSTPASQGTYLSEVRDAGTVATWGTIRWRAVTPPGTAVQIVTRSGNTARPDETWSPWSKAYRHTEDEPIASPPARYLQWKAVLVGDAATPTLTSVTAAYLPRNQRPQVTAITVHPPGTVFQRPFSTTEPEIAGLENRRPIARPSAAATGAVPSTPALGRRVYQKGLQTFVWTVRDPDDVDLEYEVSYRREGETVWRALRRGLWEPIYVWDTTTVPDGTYVVKIVASDAPANAPRTALAGERESTPFTIDNTPPRIEARMVREDESPAVVRFTVRDDSSPIRQVEYSINAGVWRAVYPVDGILDGASEEFELVIEDVSPIGEVVVRATDALNNTATAVVGPELSTARPAQRSQ